MRKKFSFEFEDESSNSTISYEYNEDIEEQLSVKIENGSAVLYGNKSAFLLLAKTFAKLGLCDYEEGFHLHINTDFDADNSEAIRIVLEKID